MQNERRLMIRAIVVAFAFEIDFDGTARRSYEGVNRRKLHFIGVALKVALHK